MATRICQRIQSNVVTSYFILGHYKRRRQLSAVGPTLRCLSKHERVGEVSVSTGGWRAPTVKRRVGEAERGRRSEKWGEMSFIDRRGQLHYRQSQDSPRCVHKPFSWHVRVSPFVFLSWWWLKGVMDCNQITLKPQRRILACWFWTRRPASTCRRLRELMRTAKTSPPREREKVSSDHEGLWENEEGGKRKTKRPFVSDAPDSPVLDNLWARGEKEGGGWGVFYSLLKTTSNVAFLSLVMQLFSLDGASATTHRSQSVSAKAASEHVHNNRTVTL